MNNINDIRIDIKPSNVQIYEQVLVMSLINQTNQEKYEAIKPVADKLNLYCDTHCIKCIEDCNFLSISFDKIQYAEYDKEDNMLMIVLKKSPNLHLLNIDAKVHTIYVYKEHHNCIVGFFLKLYNRIRIIFFRLKMKYQLIKYINKQIFSNNQKQNS
jgi:hypothetical protein|nr:MAG TPA: hypothetical protein [Caudoviricetes sp.]